MYKLENFLAAVEAEIIKALVDFQKRFPKEDVNDRPNSPDYFRGGIAAMRAVVKALRLKEEQ